MPEDDKNITVHSFDKEPSTGVDAYSDTTEHADLKHRIEADAEPDAPAAPERVEPVTPVAPAVAPVAPTESQPTVANTSAVSDELPHAGPGVLVLQWLTYAFWGWTVLTLSGLISLVVTNLVSEDRTGSAIGYWGGGIAYLLAAAVVLFIISIICDLFYARLERKHARKGATNVIMIIHAVIFALCGIGALIISVFGAVSLMIGDSDGTGAKVSIISGAISFFIYGMTLLRTLRPKWLKVAAPLYWVFMTIAIIAAVIMAVAGPVATARLQNQDVPVEDGLPGVAGAVNAYVRENNKLPVTLKDLNSLNSTDYADQSRTIVEDDKVKYVAGQKIGSTAPTYSDSINFNGSTQLGGAGPDIYHYTLCVTYLASDKEDGGYSGYGDQYIPSGQRYATDISTYGHGKGEVCYDVQTDMSYTTY